MENIDEILDAPQVEVSRLQYAGFWVRAGAYILDAILLGVAGFIIGGAIALLVDPIVGQILNFMTGVLYFGLMESSSNQGTLGKMALGIRVGDQRGHQLTLANAIGRYFGKLLSTILLCIGFLMVAWDDKCQGLHDKLADTYVFYGR
jgi:uncharacterized RDD family membrane protein YckC